MVGRHYLVEIKRVEKLALSVLPPPHHRPLPRITVSTRLNHGPPIAIERAIEELARSPNNGLILPPDASTVLHRDLIVALAARHRLPALYALKTFVAAGGLMSYGTDQNDLFRLGASYVDRILRGDKPADLPVQAPTKFETTVNLKTAKALGLDVPRHLLVAADEVIE
jgi:putative tryptophan/tyrosine transport system substrate-binding protein